MHPVRLRLLRNAYPKENCLSAISMHRFGDYDVPLGTPLVIYSDPFSAAIPGHVVEELGLDLSSRNGGYYYFGDKAKDKTKTTLTELYRITEKYTDEVLQHSLSKIRVINLFPSRADGWDHSYFNIVPKSIMIMPKVPLFWDDGFICEVDNIQGVMGDENPAKKIREMLNSYRYVTYCFSNFNKSKVSSVMNQIKGIISSIALKYPVYKSYSSIEYSESYLLMDVCAISFFRLSDVITIYDYRRADGMAVDIYAASSQLKSTNDMPGATMLTRFIFNIDKENLQSIDGEKIVRWNDRGKLDDGLASVHSFLNKNTPQHKSTNAGGV
jgi:hypothetical protein